MQSRNLFCLLCRFDFLQNQVILDIVNIRNDWNVINIVCFLYLFTKNAINSPQICSMFSFFTYSSINFDEELYLADFFPSSFHPPLTTGGASSLSLGDCTSLLPALLPCLAAGYKQKLKGLYVFNKSFTLGNSRSVSES